MLDCFFFQNWIKPTTKYNKNPYTSSPQKTAKCEALHFFGGDFSWLLTFSTKNSLDNLARWILNDILVPTFCLHVIWGRKGILVDILLVSLTLLFGVWYTLNMSHNWGVGRDPIKNWVGGRFQIFFFKFSSRTLGKWSNLTDIFQMGWNHQLVFGLVPYINLFQCHGTKVPCRCVPCEKLFNPSRIEHNYICYVYIYI